jgi:hypothetical protein
VVIINEGGNDAQGYTLPYYHPDNSNWRQPLINLRPLPKRARWLANSRFMSYIMLNVFYVDQLSGGEFYIRGGAIPPAPLRMVTSSEAPVALDIMMSNFSVFSRDMTK